MGPTLRSGRGKTGLDADSTGGTSEPADPAARSGAVSLGSLWVCMGINGFLLGEGGDAKGLTRLSGVRSLMSSALEAHR